MTIQKQFNRAAAKYDKHCIIQKKMAEELLLASKKRASSYSSILDVGCGTGVLTKALHQAFGTAHITAMDIAENMLHVARMKLSSPNITFTLQDVEAADWKHEWSYDAVLSNAVFQWLKHPTETIRRLVRQLHYEGWILASTFGPETFRELTTLFQEVEHDMGLPPYAHHLPLKSADEWSRLLAEAHLHNIHVVEKKEQLHYRDCRDFLHSIKVIGASSSQSKHSLATQKLVLQEVMKRYDDRHGINDSVSCTYHLIYMEGQKNS